ncbi:MAG: glycoside hydrolase family 3 C-terminal domain-containing protein [Deltaproteobacteria bacterium]|nr:glycoside hydrolase family 3 C-terminal domain-containing protein [Deltaproteobacteria bacterium]
MLRQRFPFAHSVSVPLALMLVLFSGACKEKKVETKGAKPTVAVLDPFRDPSRPIAERVADLLGRLTLDEKIAQLQNDAPAIDRLGVPAYDWWNEALHGVARAGEATVFPQPIGLGATFDEDLIKRIATAISDEGRAKYHRFVSKKMRGRYMGLSFWSPNINLFRDPRWGRGMETFGEDPLLSGTLGAAFVRGIQGDDPKYLKAIATPKHYAVHSGPEPLRHKFDALTSVRDLRDSYLPHFQQALAGAKAASVMCAYNRYQGEAACASKLLLDDILRGEWKWDGYVVSDCDSVKDIFSDHKLVGTEPEAAALALRRGMDLNCGTFYRDHLGAAVKKGLVTVADVDRSLTRLFTARFRLGLFDPDANVPYSTIPYSVVAGPAHNQLALEAARKSIVLLKNARGTLPLQRSIKRIAVVGPVAIDPYVAVGNYFGRSPRMTRVLEEIRAKIPEARVEYSTGSSIAEGLPAMRPIQAQNFNHIDDLGNPASGLRAEYFNTLSTEGQAAQKRIDPLIDFNWGDRAPNAFVPADGFAVRWTGRLLPDENGKFLIGVRADSAYTVKIAGKVLQKSGKDPDEAWLRYIEVDLKANKPEPIEVVMREYAGDAGISLSMGKVGDDARMLKNALDTARASDVIVAVLGLTPWLEGEEMPVKVPGFDGGDRKTLDLPKPQQALLDRLAALGKPLVLVLTGGSALSITQAAAKVPAILATGYLGQAGGTALADVLFGDYSPSGRLPMTYYKSVSQLPPFESYDMKGRTYRYLTTPPLFPFGHGLSYSKFRYSELKLPETVEAGQGLVVTAKVENIGPIDADEVVQLYVRDVEASAPVPVRALKGFSRIRLRAGNSQELRFELKPEDFSIIDDENRRMIEPGAFEISVGGKQPGLKGTADAETTGVVIGTIEVTGSPKVLTTYAAP